MADNQNEGSPLLWADSRDSSGGLSGYDCDSERSSVESQKGSSSTGLHTSRGYQHASDYHDVFQGPGAEDSSAAQNSRCSRKRWVLIEPIIMCFIMSLIAFTQFFPQYVYARLYEKYNVTAPTENNTCEFHDETNQDSVYDAIEKEMAIYNTASSLFYLIPGIVLLPIIGPCSEKFGRKPFIVVPVVGMSALYIIMTAIIYYELPLNWVYAALTFLGITGGAAIVPVMGMVYITDTTEHEQRTSRFIIFEISSMTGSCVAQIGTGYIIKYLGFVSVMLIGAIILAGLFLYTLFLPESKQDKKRRVPCNCGDLGKGLMVYINDDGTRRRYKLQICLLVLGLFFLAEMGSSSILTYFFLDPPFCWASDEIGIFNAVNNVLKIITSVLISRFLVGRVMDTLLMLVCGASLAGYFLVLSFSTTTWMAYIAIAVGLCGMTLPPLVRGFSSRLVSNEHQASFLSGVMVTQLVFVLMGTFLFNFIYALSARTYHGLALFVAAGILLLAAGLVLTLACCMKLEPKVVVPSEITVVIPARNFGAFYGQVLYDSLPKTTPVRHIKRRRRSSL